MVIVKHNLDYQQFADIINKLPFHNLNFDKNFAKYCCKNLKRNSPWSSNFLESIFSGNSKKIYFEQLENRSLESFLNQNKELISKLDDSTRKISSLEETISAANHRRDEKS